MESITAETFLSLVWPKNLIRFEMLELRAIRRSDNSIRREFLSSQEEFLKKAKSYGEGWDIYFGVSTRFQSGGKKKDCYRIRCVWVDLDTKDLPDFGEIQPDLVVSSGGGYHLYWIFEDPVYIRGGRWREIEAINRALCKKFKGDIASIDVSRILRLPGTNNYKHEKPRPVKAFRNDIQD